MEREEIYRITNSGKVIPVGELVRCKDCKHWNAEEHDCNIKTGWFACGAYWFCADGIRKDGGE